MLRSILCLFVLLCKCICVAQEYSNPVFERTDLEVLHPHIDKVVIDNKHTIVLCTLRYNDSWSYSIPKSMYIEDLITEKKYRISYCKELPFEPQKHHYNNGGTFQFEFVFPRIENLRLFNIIENSSEERIFNIYGINLSKYNSIVYDENEYRRLKNMSDYHKIAGNNDKYLEFKGKELSAARYIFGTRSIAASTCYSELSAIYSSIGNHSKAIEYGIEALECDSLQYGVENKEYPVFAYTLNNLSSLYLSAGDDNKAVQCMSKCIDIWEHIGNTDNYTREMVVFLQSAHDADGINNRLKIMEDKLKTVPVFASQAPFSIASILKHMALYYWMVDNNQSAINCCEKALSYYEKEGKIESEDFAKLLSSLCKYQRNSGLIDAAIMTGERAKRIYDSHNNRSTNYAELMGDLAWVYGLNYNFEKSIELQSVSVDIFKSAKDWLSLAETYNNISDYYQRAEKLSDAELFVKEAISLLNEYDDVNKIIRADAERLGDSTIITPFAMSQIKRRLDYDRISFRQSLAKIYIKEGKIMDAINTEKENVCFLKNMRDDKAYALHLIILAQYYVLNKQFNSAKECIEQAFQFDKNQYSIEQDKILLSHVYFEMGDTKKAIQYAKEAISFFRSKGDTNNFIISEYALSLFYWKSNDYLKAEQYMSETLDLLKNMICNEFVGLTNQQKQRIWSIYEKYFIFYRHIIAKTSRNDELLSKLYNYILFSKSFLLDAEIDSDRDELIRVKFNWQDVKQHLSIDAIAIEFISTMEDEGNYNTYHALIIDKNTPSPRMITLYSESKLEEIKKIDKRDIRDIVGELIWKPILAQYITVKDIYFSADGILHMLPIEYYSADGTNSMFEKFNMHRLSSTKELIHESDKYQPKSAVLYGGLDYNQLKESTIGPNKSEMSSIWRGIADRGGFDPIFNTALETQEIKELLIDKNIKTTLYSGESGTEESFRNLSGQSHGIIHLATHGMYINPEGVAAKRNEYNFDFLETLASLDDPVKEDVVLTHSFLVMSGGNKLIARESVPDKNNDGILTSKEISQLDFLGLELVVLSACESALGDIDNGGVYGLQRGFKKAGAHTILMSLDKVDDEATKILMVEFYRNLMDGKTKLQSLRNAQKYLRSVENGKYDDPKYWASFIMLDGLN